MMSCTRLNIESTETLMGQARKRMLQSLLMERSKNMRGHNLPNIISNTKDAKLALIGPFFWILGTLISPFYGVLSLKFPYPLVSPCPPATPLPLFGRSQGHLSAILRFFIIQVPPNPDSQRISDSACVSSSP